MSHEIISSWVEKAKSAAMQMPESDGVQVIRRGAPNNSGTLIMEIAEKIRPWLMEIFTGSRDENDMLVQPARIRGIALNVAQSLVKEHEQNANTQ